MPAADPLAEPRVARRLRAARWKADAAPVGPQARAQQTFLDTALRSRSARLVRTFLRRMEPVFVATPRWSRPQAFLEEVALDLAVGEPSVGCRTVGFRPLKSRGPAGAWPFLLAVLGQLGRGASGDTVATAVDRQAFRAGVGEALEAAHRSSRHRLAVLMHGIENLPVEVLADLVEEWSRYRQDHPEGARVTLLLAGAERPDWLQLPDLHEVRLEDYSESETIAAIVARCGPLPPRRLLALARFTGGVPAVVDAVAELVQAKGPRLDVDLMLQGMGPIADEMRGALDIVAARGELADRLNLLARASTLPADAALDASLRAAGLLRQRRRAGQDEVCLRSPALAALLA